MQNMSERRTGTVTFLFTDVEGSTELLKRLGRERYGELLHEQQRLLREIFTANHGGEVDTKGDSFLVAFRSASDAVAAPSSSRTIYQRRPSSAISASSG